MRNFGNTILSFVVLTKYKRHTNVDDNNCFIWIIVTYHKNILIKYSPARTRRFDIVLPSDSCDHSDATSEAVADKVFSSMTWSDGKTLLAWEHLVIVLPNIYTACVEDITYMCKCIVPTYYDETNVSQNNGNG